MIPDFRVHERQQGRTPTTNIPNIVNVLRLKISQFQATEGALLELQLGFGFFF